MDNVKIVKLNTSTKVLYSLFNFFAPISFICIGICALEAYNIKAALFALISIFVGLFCLIFNLIRYNRFLCISDKTITVCKGKINNPKIIKIIKTENLTPKKLNTSLTVKYENKKIKLLHTSFSILGILCYTGPFVVIPIMKNYNTAFRVLTEIYQILPELFDSPLKKQSKAEDITINFIVWCFVLFVSFLGCLGILMAPFYPFMNS